MPLPRFVVAALYKFAPLQNFKDIQKPLKELCDQHKVKGILLLALEGINGTIAGSREGIDAVLSYLRSQPALAELEHKESYTSDQNPFHRMRVRLKKEIVTLGVPWVDPTKEVGTYVDPKDWNDLISDPDVILVDTRNEYEYAIGTFKGAQNPHTDSFREFPEYVDKNLDPKKHKKVAMFCTGGIRCEKSTAFMLGKGFEEVYHLKGGILKYLENVPQEDSLWDGECFVFDGRVGVKHGLAVGDHDLCYGCRHPITEEDKLSELYETGVCCPRCHDKITPEQRERFRMRHAQVLRGEKAGQRHIGS